MPNLLRKLWTLRRQSRTVRRLQSMPRLNKPNAVWLCGCACTLLQDNFAQKAQIRPPMHYFPLSVHHFAVFRGSIARWLAYFWPIPHAVDAVLGGLQRFGRAFVDFFAHNAPKTAPKFLKFIRRVKPNKSSFV